MGSKFVAEEAGSGTRRSAVCGNGIPASLLPKPRHHSRRHESLIARRVTPIRLLPTRDSRSSRNTKLIHLIQVPGGAYDSPVPEPAGSSEEEARDHNRRISVQ
jgi:hypothetical protein